MKTIPYLFTFLALLLGFSLAAQDKDKDKDEYENSQDYLESLMGSYNNVVLLSDSRYVAVKGSPYFIDEWKTGNIVTSEGKVIMDVTLKLNAYENELYVKVNKKERIMIDNATIKGFVLKDSFTTHTFVKEDVLKYKATFFEVIGAGNVTVLKKPHINLFESDNDSGYQMEKSNTFKSSPKYFIKVGSKKYKVLRRSKSALLKNVPSRIKKKLKSYLIKEKIDLKKDADFVKTMKWINDELKKKEEDKKDM